MITEEAMERGAEALRERAKMQRDRDAAKADYIAAAKLDSLMIAIASLVQKVTGAE